MHTTHARAHARTQTKTQPLPEHCRASAETPQLAAGTPMGAVPPGTSGVSSSTAPRSWPHQLLQNRGQPTWGSTSKGRLGICLHQMRKPEGEQPRVQRGDKFGQARAQGQPQGANGATQAPAQLVETGASLESLKSDGTDGVRRPASPGPEGNTLQAGTSGRLHLKSDGEKPWPSSPQRGAAGPQARPAGDPTEGRRGRARHGRPSRIVAAWS